MDTELVVVWDGAHKNCDADLLFAGIRQPQKLMPEATPMALSASAVRFAVFDVLPTSQERAITIGELMSLSGASYGSASQALFRLRQQGILRTEIAAERRVGSGQRPRLYWRRKGEAA